MKARMRASASQALVEFALILPLMLLLVLGTVQVVLYAHARDVVLTSVQEGARLAAEQGRLITDGSARSQALVDAGLGASVDGLMVTGAYEGDSVTFQANAWLRPILPLPSGVVLPIHAQASVSLERFRPGGGTGATGGTGGTGAGGGGGR
jgi:hypothetical protein